MDMETRVIFLDVDGVLNCRPQTTRDFKNRNNPYDNSYKIHEPFVKNLSKIYHKYYNTKIVLTSSWKKIMNMDQGLLLLDKLEKYGMIIDEYSPEYNSDTGEFLLSRPEEIKEYLKLHPEVDHWVSLDDDYSYTDYDSIEKGFSKHLCKTFYGKEEDDIDECGLNKFKMHVALEIIGGCLN